MALTHTHYELGGRTKIANAKSPIFLTWNKANPIEGISAYVRDEATGEYVRIYEVGPTEWVQGEPQAWSRGNFETEESVQRFGSMAYRWLNKRRAA
jgi:hypothetical protein